MNGGKQHPALCCQKQHVDTRFLTCALYRRWDRILMGHASPANFLSLSGHTTWTFFLLLLAYLSLSGRDRTFFVYFWNTVAKLWRLLPCKLARLLWDSHDQQNTNVQPFPAFSSLTPHQLATTPPQFIRITHTFLSHTNPQTNPFPFPTFPKSTKAKPHNCSIKTHASAGTKKLTNVERSHTHEKQKPLVECLKNKWISDATCNKYFPVRRGV